MDFNKTYQRLAKAINKMENEKQRAKVQEVLELISNNACDYTMGCTLLPEFTAQATWSEEKIQKSLQDAAEKQLLAEHGEFKTNREFIDALQTKVSLAMAACYFVNEEKNVYLDEDGSRLECTYTV